MHAEKLAATMVTAYVGLGANIGDPPDALRVALRELAQLPGTRLARASSFYRSAPVGRTDQPDYLNAVAELETSLAARPLLEALLDAEARAGRERSFANAPRTLDLDLLLYGEAIIDEPGLRVPHPRMHERRFVLEPLLEIAPDCFIPGVGSAAERLAQVRNQSVERVQDGS